MTEDADFRRTCVGREARNRRRSGFASLSGLLLVSLALAAEDTPRAETLRFDAVRDVWISAVDGETEFSMGAARKLKLKVWQEFALVDFELSALEGKRIRSAYLYLKPAGGERLGLNHGTDLRWLTVSTVSHPWVEGASRRYGRDTRGFGATFRESSYSQRDWGWSGSRLWDVILGNGNTLRMDGQLEPAGDGWLRIELDTRLVSAMMDGASYGIAILDGSTEVISNCYVWSRESGHGPFLEVTAEESPPLPVPAIEELEVRAAQAHADLDSGALEVAFVVPRSAFSYDVWVEGKALPRWRIPFAAKPGTSQTITIAGLPPDAELAIAVVVRDLIGSRSPPIAANARSSAVFPLPSLADLAFQPVGADPPRVGPALIWALPELTEIDPVTAAPLFEHFTDDPRRRNAVWDAKGRRIRLAAARGEIVSFQVAIEGEATHCVLQTASLTGPGEIPADRFRLWRNWYVGRQSEYALPLTSPFNVPPADSAVTGQRLQAISVDLHLPAHAIAGRYTGTVAVACEAGRVDLHLDLEVYDVVIPEDIHCNVELNCYEGPGPAGSDRFIRSFQLAHYHRATINRVPYSHRGRVNSDWAPQVDATGRIVAWDRFDRNLGGLLDGSWFAENPRAGVPVPVLYLPLFEGWPVDFRQHYDPGQGVPVQAESSIRRLEHDSQARPIEEALDSDFKRAFVDAVKATRTHLQQRSWNRTIFQFYLNNKPGYGYTLWNLDEPFKYLDWAALNFFGRLFKAGIEDPETYTAGWQRQLFESGLSKLSRDRPTLLFRADVSRPMWQGSVSDGVIHWLYVGGIAPQVPEILRSMKERGPMLMSQYGSAPAVDEDNWQAAAWPLTAFIDHFDGVLPWQSLGGPAALHEATGNALLIDGGEYGDAIASLRVHALRRGAQDCELLRLLQLRTGWSRAQLALLVGEKLPLHIDRGNSFASGTSSPSLPGPTSARSFLEFKEGLLRLLENLPSTPSSGAALPQLEDSPPSRDR